MPIFFNRYMLCFVFDYGTISMTLNVGELFILKTLRITFCILACISVAAVVPVGIFFDWYCLIPVVAAAAFAALTVGAKNGFKRPKPVPKPDFMNSDEENEKINRNDK